MMMRKRFARNRKAVEPVLATVILVAVTLVVALASSHWMATITGMYTGVEKVDIVAVEVNVIPQGWQLKVFMKNTGSADAAISGLEINGKSSTTLGLSTTPDLTAEPYLLKAGSMGSIQVVIPIGTPGCSSGTTIEVVLNSAAGWGFGQSVTLI